MDSALNNGYNYTDRIDDAGRGMTVIDFYAGRYRHSSRGEWIERLHSGRVTRNGATAGEDDVLAAGDVLVYHRPPWREAPVPDDVPVLYEDDALVAFAKPAGLPVLPGGGYLEHTMLALVRARHGARLAPVQRLDRGTSGVIVFSKTVDAARSLSALFRGKRVRKTYLAIVAGTGMPDVFEIVTGRSGTQRPDTSVCTTLSRNAGSNTAVVIVETSSGGTHQVRRHLATAGWPLAGDPLYDARGAMTLPEDEAERAGLTGACGFTLHAWKVALPHPTDGSALEIVADPKDELKIEN